MMKRFFLKKDFVIKFVLLTIVFFLILDISLFIYWILLMSSLIFFFRRNIVTYKNSLSNAVDIVLSPVTGRVTGLLKDNDGNQFIKIRMHTFGPYGLFLPYSSEIQMRQNFSGKKLWRGSKEIKPNSDAERFLVEFKNKLGHITSVEVFSCVFSGKPDVWLVAGDRGRSTACFGYIPFGGSVLVKVPQGSNLLINENEKVRAGFTILAGMKG